MWINAVIFMIFANVSHDFCQFYRDFLLSLLIRNKPARLIQHWDAQKWQQQHACIDFQFLSSFDHVRNPVARITDPDDRRQCHAPLSCSAKRRANQWRQCCLLVGVRQDYAVILCRLTQHPQCIKSVHNLSQWEPEIIIIIRWHALRTNISSQMSPSGGKSGTSIYDQPINIRHTSCQFWRMGARLGPPQRNCSLASMHLTHGHYARSWGYRILAMCQMRKSEKPSAILLAVHLARTTTEPLQRESDKYRPTGSDQQEDQATLGSVQSRQTLALWNLASRLPGEMPLLETNGDILWTQQCSSGVRSERKKNQHQSTDSAMCISQHHWYSCLHLYGSNSL